jgi:hypothetical protein
MLQVIANKQKIALKQMSRNMDASSHKICLPLKKKEVLRYVCQASIYIVEAANKL